MIKITEEYIQLGIDWSNHIRQTPGRVQRNRVLEWDNNAKTYTDDYNSCLRDAQAGNEDAQFLIASFMEGRMKK